VLGLELRATWGGAGRWRRMGGAEEARRRGRTGPDSRSCFFTLDLLAFVP
jgi:hypothetical protein